MRELKPEEVETVFGKLAKYIGKNVEKLIDRNDGKYVFRVLKDRVYYMSEQLEKMASNVPRKHLIGSGLLIGKFTHHKKFHIKITALPLLAVFAPYRIRITPASELSFLYKNDVMKSHITHMSEGIPDNAGVVIVSADDQPVGFGVTTKSGNEALNSDPASKIVIHQADVGEFLRDQDTMF